MHGTNHQSLGIVDRPPPVGGACILLGMNWLDIYDATVHTRRKVAILVDHSTSPPEVFPMGQGTESSCLDLLDQRRASPALIQASLGVDLPRDLASAEASAES